MRFIVRECHFNQIIMGTDFDNLDKRLMIEIVRRKQLQQVRFFSYFFMKFSGR